MDFSYAFKQAQNDRLEDANLKLYAHQYVDDDYIGSHEFSKRTLLGKQIERTVIATVHRFVK